MIDFPQSPTVGQQFSAAGVVWTWDGEKWTASGLSIAYVPLAGFVPAMNDNRIINGDMRINQRGSINGTVSGYFIDRWLYGYSTSSSNLGWGQGTDNPGGPVQAVGFTNYMNLGTSGTAYTPAANDSFSVSQAIEADMIGDFRWGMPNAQPVTLSFWASSNLVGTFSGSLCSGSSPYRSYPFTFSIPTANVMIRIAVTIPGDTGGATWALSGNGVGVFVRFDLGCGANFRSPANVWANGNFLGATGSIVLVSNANSGLSITGVKLEIGNVATPFNRQSLAKSLADCQRYYSTGSGLVSGYNIAGGNIIGNFFLPAEMRTTPTITPTRSSLSNMNGTFANQTVGPNTFIDYGQLSTMAQGQYTISWTASAEI